MNKATRFLVFITLAVLIFSINYLPIVGITLASEETCTEDCDELPEQPEDETPIEIPEPKVIITEIYPSPNSNDNENEWIEIFNNGEGEVDLTGWYFQRANFVDESDNTCRTTSTTLRFSALGLEPNKYTVGHRSVSSDIQRLEIGFSFDLANNGANIFLCNSDNNIVDNISYPGLTSGKSYARVWQVDAYTDQFAITTIPTPGEVNQFPPEPSEIPPAPIRNARTAVNETTVTVEGVVTVTQDILGENIFYIQDQTSGIKISSTAALPFAEQNNKVKITGVKRESRKEAYIKAASITKLENQNVQAQNHPAVANWEDKEGQLVTVSGQIVNNYSTSFDIAYASGKIRVSILSATGIEIEKSKGDFATVTGIVSQYNDLYRILPRYQTDVTITPKPVVAKSTSTKKSSSSVAGVVANSLSPIFVGEMDLDQVSVIRSGKSIIEQYDPASARMVFLLGAIISGILLLVKYAPVPRLKNSFAHLKPKVAYPTFITGRENVITVG